MMFAIFDASGKIGGLVSCPDEEVEHNLPSGMACLPVVGMFDFDGYYVDAGKLIAKPAQPTFHHAFDYATKQWQDPRTLADLQAAKWLEVKVARTAAIDAPLVTPYGTFDSDAKARTAITDSVLMLQTLAALGNPQSIDFTLADNEVVTLDTAQMVTVGLMLGQKVQEAHSKARALRIDITDATSLEQVEAVTW